MKTFTTVMQVTGGKFDVLKFNGESQSRLYPQTRDKGIVIAIRESSKENDEYLFNLAEQMNNDKSN